MIIKGKMNELDIERQELEDKYTKQDGTIKPLRLWKKEDRVAYRVIMTMMITEERRAKRQELGRCM